MLYKVNISLFWNPYKTQTQCGQNVQFLNVKSGGTSSNQ